VDHMNPGTNRRAAWVLSGARCANTAGNVPLQCEAAVVHQKNICNDLSQNRAKCVPTGNHQDGQAHHQPRALRSRAALATRASLGRDF